jgi:hypothetical protein
MPRKKKTEKKSETQEEIIDVTDIVTELVPIADILKNENSILGDGHRQELPRNAEFSPVFLDMATRMVAAGFTEGDLAYTIGCTPARIKYWKRHNPLFKKACESGKAMAKSYLVAGYATVEKNIKIKRKYITKDGKDVLIEYPAEISEFHKHQAPNPGLLMFMLCNMSRQAGDEIPWASTHKVEVEENKKVTVEIKGEIASEQIDRLAGAFRPENIIEATFENAKDSKGSSDTGRLLQGDTDTHSE